MRSAALVAAMCVASAAAAFAEPREGEPGSRKRGKGKFFKRETHDATKPKPQSDSLKRLLGKKPRRDHSHG